MLRKNMSDSRLSQGYTLVELMIGMLISLLVGGVALTFMLSSSRTLATQNAEDVIQENARFALEILASSIRLAGSNTSSNIQTQVLAQGVFTGTICDGQNCNVSNVTHTTGAYGRNQITSQSDRAAFEHITNQGKTCTGADITFEKQIVSVFYVDDPDGDGVSSLYCQAYEAILDYVSQTYTNHTAPAAPVPMIDGIEMLQIQYGIDVDGTDEGTIDRYMPYDQITNNDWLSRIKAVRIGLVLSNTQEEVASSQATESTQSRTITVLDGTLTSNDAVLRQAVTTTVYLPNSSSNI